MEHWIEPTSLGNYQRSGYGSPTVQVSDLRNGGAWTPPQPGSSELPNLPPPGVQHYVNRPGQFAGMGASHAIVSKLPMLIAAIALGVIAAPWIKKQIRKLG